MRPGWVLAVWAIAVGCGVSDRRTRCGIAALAGPTLLLEEFTKPGRTLAAPPAGGLPEIIPVRVVAGEAQRGIVGKTDSGWVIGVDSPLPEKPMPGFGTLLIDPQAGAQGVLLYEGKPIPGAPIIGQVNIGAAYLPLIGLTTTIAGFQDPNCPLFPDSLRR